MQLVLYGRVDTYHGPCTYQYNLKYVVLGRIKPHPKLKNTSVVIMLLK